MPRKGAGNAARKRFILGYVEHGNGARAARDAGYRPSNAAAQAVKLLSIPAVAAEVARRREEQFQRLQMSADEVLSFLAAVVRADLGAALNEDGTAKPLDEWPADVRKALTGLEVREESVGRGDDAKLGVVTKLKLADKIAAAALIVRKHGLLVDKVQHEVSTPLEELIREAVKVGKPKAP